MTRFSSRIQILAVLFAALILLPWSAGGLADENQTGIVASIWALEKTRLLPLAEKYLGEQPLTLTSFPKPADVNAGGPHDFYSEADYWWPDPRRPGGPYIRRDGHSNPGIFNEHRKAIMRLRDHVGTLASAYLLTRDEKYLDPVRRHLKAWFQDPETRMTPDLRYSQAIRGRMSGRGAGIIDTLHLVEVARAVTVLEKAKALSATDTRPVKKWFAKYLKWIMRSSHGDEEKSRINNHGVAWALQVAAFAQLTGDKARLAKARQYFKKNVIEMQMNAEGGFPAELRRTKPYGYSLFTLDLAAALAWIASTPNDNLWAYEGRSGRSLKKAVDFLIPYVRDKSAWPYGRDVQCWEEWPKQHCGFLFSALALGRVDVIELWSAFKPESETFEVVRNLPLRHPLLWMFPDYVPEEAGAPASKSYRT